MAVPPPQCLAPRSTSWGGIHPPGNPLGARVAALDPPQLKPCTTTQHRSRAEMCTGTEVTREVRPVPQPAAATARESTWGCWTWSHLCAPRKGHHLGGIHVTTGSRFCLEATASLLHTGGGVGERRETFYDANSAKNKVEINLPIHALKGASFSVMLRCRNPSSSVFTGKRFDQDLRTEKKQQPVPHAEPTDMLQGGFYQDRGDAFLHAKVPARPTALHIFCQ